MPTVTLQFCISCAFVFYHAKLRRWASPYSSQRTASCCSRCQAALAHYAPCHTTSDGGLKRTQNILQSLNYQQTRTCTSVMLMRLTALAVLHGRCHSVPRPCSENCNVCCPKARAPAMCTSCSLKAAVMLTGGCNKIIACRLAAEVVMTILWHMRQATSHRLHTCSGTAQRHGPPAGCVGVAAATSNDQLASREHNIDLATVPTPPMCSQRMRCHRPDIAHRS